jgi:ATP-dependent protease ClpP protease subunit
MTKPIEGAPAVPPKKTVYVNFCAEIVPATTESLMAAIANLVNQGTERIYLLLSTPGGSVMHGMTLYNYLRALPCEVVIHNAGSVNSIGNVIFLAAEKERRYACAHSTFMFHGVGFDVPPGTRAEEKFLRERLDSVLSDQNRIGQILQERTQITAEQAEALFREAQTKDVTYAIGCGIVHEIHDIQIPAGNPIVSLVFKR